MPIFVVHMNYEAYKQLFDEILDNPNPGYPYNNEQYFNYTRLNKSRMRRWDKQLVLDEKLVNRIKEISERQHWIIITEPWCGDAAHIIPFLIRMTEQNDGISYDIQLRDTPPLLIESYLTAGTKSIPKLIVRDMAGNDLFVWGPRPVGAQTLREQLKADQADAEASKVALQNWYNEDRGKSLQEELVRRFLR
ncbi:Thioredoxin [Chitinophaga arvensicola]|uniref:Thioredoxin n=1 Tax=Chitinophaga arvensicola TaxID=29529 RepID=A0A1I0RV07_9BACT|nr:thioredoxin family protein [Chitinophaga arvensicola]SEW45213.1 Thioredoxin [Chitinophaga arvensicola]